MSFEPLASADAAFLHIESDHEPQHVGSLSIIDGRPLRGADGRIRLDELRATIEGRLHGVPRLRQRLRFVPLGQGPPVWVDDDRFDIDYHVRLTGLPRPGDGGQLDALMSRLQSEPLDRDRPLWELWFVDGLADDRIGLIIKTHHALGDGIANVDLAMALVDLEPDPPADEPAPPWQPAPSPSPAALLVNGVSGALREPVKLARSGLAALRDPGPAVDAVRDTVQTLVGFATRPSPAPWNVPVSSHRRWSRATVPLSTVRAVRDATPCTINDVVLAACTGALRTYLDDISDEGAHSGTSPEPLKAMVPVSRRSDDERGEALGNRVSLIVVDLPVDKTDPITRLEQVHAQTSELKGSGLADGAEHIVDLAGHVPPIAGPMARLLSRTIPMNLVITNIPGPPVPLWVGGGRLFEAYPYVEVIDGEGLTIAVVSYEDRLHFGLTADRDVMPDLDRLAHGIGQAAVELAESATGGTTLDAPAERATVPDL